VLGAGLSGSSNWARTSQGPWWRRHPYLIGALLAGSIISVLLVLAVATAMYSVWEAVPAYASAGAFGFVASMLLVGILLVLPEFILTVSAMKALAMCGVALVLVESAIVARRVRGPAR
jgi:hypothetical protein